MLPKTFHCTKKQGNPRINVSKMSQRDLEEQFAEAFEQDLGTSQLGDSDKWEAEKDTMLGLVGWFLNVLVNY